MKNRISFIAGILLMTTVAGTGLSHADGTKNMKGNSEQDRRIR